MPMKHRRFCYVVVLTAALTASCSSPEGGSSNNPLAPTSGASTNLEPELTFCVTETNRYRASVGLSALTRSSTLETYAAAGAHT